MTYTQPQGTLGKVIVAHNNALAIIDFLADDETAHNEYMTNLQHQYSHR
jgi:hypothetical protein